MSDTKRRVITFKESDLDWINPLLLQYEKENGDKKSGDLIAELMKEYKETLGPKKSDVLIEKVRGDIEQLKNGLGTRTASSRIRMGEVFSETKDKINQATSKMTAVSKNAVEKIQSQVEDRKKK